MNWQNLIQNKFLLAVFVTVTATGTGAAPDNAPANNDPGIEPQKGGLAQVDLELFEHAEDWRAKATCPLGETKLLKQYQMGEMTDTMNPAIKPALNNPEKEDGAAASETVGAAAPQKNRLLGVKTYFCEKGFDRVEMYPPHEYVLKGKPRQFSLWVLGRNFNHTMFVKLRDYQGKLHTLKLGKLNYFGWKQLTVTIPGWIPQSTRYASTDKKMKFVSLYIQSDVHEVIGPYYSYFDFLQYVTDDSELTYPGYEIKDNW